MSHRKKRIGVIGLKGLPSFGGAARVGEGIIEELKERYDFTVYATASHTEKSGDLGGYRQIVFSKLPVRNMNVLYYYFVSALHSLLLGRYDLIHLHHVDGAFIAPLLRLRYKVIGTTHARPQQSDKWASMAWYFKRMEKMFLRYCNTATSVAKTLRDTVAELGNRQVHFIPNGINLNERADDSPLPHKDYLMFAAGRIMATKGCHTFLEALHRLNYKDKVLIVGDLDQVPEYGRRIRELAQGLNVTFIPLIREKDVLLNYVRNAKVFVFPTTTEAMSIMMLEVAAMRTPMVCSDIAENTAVFDDDETLYFRTEDDRDLAEKIEYALLNEENMNRRIERAYAKLVKDYTWGKVSLRYASLFDDLMK